MNHQDGGLRHRCEVNRRITIRPTNLQCSQPRDCVGWLSVTIPIESIDRAASGLIALGADAEVVEPSELRERLATTVQELVRLYARPRSS
jgi:predicted DNA-binding transcriptional regulator YafY